MFATFIIVFYCAHSRTKTKSVLDKNVSSFNADRELLSVTPVIGEIENVCLWNS